MGATRAQRPPPVSCATAPARRMAGGRDLESPEPVISRLRTSAVSATGVMVSVKHVAESARGLSTLASVVETTLAPAVGQPPIRRTSIPVREVGGPKGPVASPD